MNTTLQKIQEIYETTFQDISKIKNINLVDQNKLTISEIVKKFCFSKKNS